MYELYNQITGKSEKINEDTLQEIIEQNHSAGKALSILDQLVASGQPYYTDHCVIAPIH